MKKEYRFRHPKGRAIEVMFRFRPGKWKSTGCHNMADAVEFAIKEIAYTQGGLSKEKEKTTLYDFAKDFFTEKDPRGYRKRLMRRGVSYEQSFFEQHQSRLDNYILPAHGDYLINAISDVMIEDFILDLEKLALALFWGTHTTCRFLIFLGSCTFLGDSHHLSILDISSGCLPNLKEEVFIIPDSIRLSSYVFD